MGEASDPGEIEVGASTADGDLRYWRAKEAVRQGELRLAEQAAIRTALESRAAALTGWSATSLLAVTAATVASNSSSAWSAGSLAGCALFVAATLGVVTARPRDWGLRGYDPRIILDDTLETELEVLESLAKGLSPAIQSNNRRLNGMARLLRWSGNLLIGAPLLGASVYAVVRSLTS